MTNIKTQIETLLYEEAPDFEISKVLKKEIKEYFSTLEESFAYNSGKGFLVKHTKKIDTIIQLVYRVAMRSMFGTYMPMRSTLPITLLALGSYGREQLCVYSDIDLMIVYKEIPGYNTQEMIEKILYILWDAGLKLGHRVHEVGELFEASQSDITIKTSMLESRFIEGSKQLWDQTQTELNHIRKDNPKAFINAKIEEMQTLHRRFPMTMEPNLKEGVGGFRNANLVYWIGNIKHNIKRIRDLDSTIVSDRAYAEFHEALEFLFKVRSALHLATQKKEDRLRLELIPQVAQYLGYKATQNDHLKLSRKVISCLKIIKLHTTIWIDALTEYYDRKTMLTPIKHDDNYHALLEQLINAPVEKFPVHPTFLKALNHSYRPPHIQEQLYPLLLKIFEHPQSHLILSTLIDTRLLGYTIPYIKKVIDLPQFDGYHQYSVGIHSVKSVQALENIDDQRIKALYEKLSSKEKSFIKVVTLLHDAGKGRKRAHEEVGAILFKSFGKRLNLSNEEIILGKTLILHHTLMSTTAQREDLHAEQVILKFSSYFPTQKALDFIYLLTYADMRGVGNNTYNDFSAKLIATLYTQASLAISNIDKLRETTKRVRKETRLKRLKPFKKMPKSLQKKILNITSDLLFIKNTPQEIIQIAQRAINLEDYSFKIDNHHFLTIEIFRRDNLDLAYLLHKLSHLDIVQMDIYKLFSGIKYFKLEFNTSIEEGDYILLQKILLDALNHTYTLNLPKPIIERKRIDINCHHSQEHARMIINCSDQKGLLSYIIKLFDSLNIDISSAKIHTKMNRVNDLFLIEKNGNFCNNINHIIKELTEY
jgi:[protein-PII] uridylyltransferase